MYWSVFCIAMNGLKCLVWSIFILFVRSAAWSNMTDPWQNFSEAEFHLFSFLCTTVEIPSKVVSNVTKSSASDDLLHVNCNVTNRTQTCFRSTQVVYCLPGVWVLVLYWRSFYFVVIVESLLLIFVYRSFCFRYSAVCFGAFCIEGNAAGFKFRFDMRIQ